MKRSLIIFILIIAVAAIVWHRASYATTVVPILFCPHMNQLEKNPVKGNWTAQTKEGLWKSYGLSFATRPTQFVGAQWDGENVGQMTCIYRSEQELMVNGQNTIQHTLSILMVYHALTFQPTTGKWKHVKRGIYNCYSTNRSDCPFKINIKPPSENIYKEAESLKSDADDNSLQPPTH